MCLGNQKSVLLLLMARVDSEFMSSAYDKDSPHYNIIITMFQLLEKQYLNSRIFVEQELEKLAFLKKSMCGRDDRSLPAE